MKLLAFSSLLFCHLALYSQIEYSPATENIFIDLEGTMTYIGSNSDGHYFQNLEYSLLGGWNTNKLYRFSGHNSTFETQRSLLKEGVKGSINALILDDQIVSVNSSKKEEGKGVQIHANILDPKNELNEVSSFNLAELSDAKTKDYMVNLSGTSANGKYTAVLTTSIKSLTFRDLLQMTPIGWLTLFIPRSKSLFIREYNMTVLDENGEVSWTKNWPLGQQKVSTFAQELHVTNSGTVLMVVRELTGNSRLGSTNEVSTPLSRIYLIKEKGREPKEVKLKLDGSGEKLITDYKICEYDNHFYLAAMTFTTGFKGFSLGVKPSRIFDGLNINKIDAKGKVKKSSIFHAKSEIFNGMIHNRGLSLKILGTPLIPHFSVIGDTLSLVVEDYILKITEFKTIDRSTGRTEFSRIYDDYLFGDLIVFQADLKDRIHWKSVVEKSQRLASEKTWGSAFVMKNDEGFTFFYNQLVKENEKALISLKGRYQHHAVQMNNDGKITYDQMHPEPQIPIVPKSCIQIDKQNALLYGQKDGEIMLCPVEVK